MQPLLRISSVPISIEYKVTRAALRHSSEPASVNIQRSPGQMNIRTTRPQLEIDSTESKASIGLKSAPRSVQEFASKGLQAGQEATKKFAEQGTQILNTHGDENAVAQIIASNAFDPPAQTALAFAPAAPQVSIEPGSISFDYSMDKLTFDWNVNDKPQLEFVPGNIEFSVAQYNTLEIEYVGDFIYAPPSANPALKGTGVNTSA